MDEINTRENPFLISKRPKLHEKIDAMRNKSPNPQCGSICRTSSGRSYLYGPRFMELASMWQNFVLSTRNKTEGMIFHYGKYTDMKRTRWCDNVSRRIVGVPLDDATAMLLCSMMRRVRPDVAAIFSGSLLADLILWVRNNPSWKFKRDVIFTTFEPFPAKLLPCLLDFCGDWCDYARAWETGLTFWRCSKGSYHTNENVAGVSTDSKNQFVCTDFLNEAAINIEVESGDYGEVMSEACSCGYDAGPVIKWQTSNWSIFQSASGEDVNLFPNTNCLPVGWQCIQEKNGMISLLCPQGWNGEDQIAVEDQLDPYEMKMKFKTGWSFRGNKKPHGMRRNTHTFANVDVEQTRYASI